MTSPRWVVAALAAVVVAAACSSSGDDAAPSTGSPTSTLTTSTTIAPTLTTSTTVTPTTRSSLRVPEEYSTIQAAIDAAADGDTVLVSPGIYGPVVIDGVDLTLTAIDVTDPGATVIDGGGGDFAIDIRHTTTARIAGFTIRNADDGVVTRDARFEFVGNLVTDTNDGIDYESTAGGISGGLVRDSVFEFNNDDGIDLDDAVAVVIEDSVLRHNGNDGIEIRLHGYEGPTLEVVIRRNRIHDNDGDGIQLIGYPEPSERRFVIERNLIHHNGDAGVGLMSDGETDEDFRGAPIPDPIRVVNNTFDANRWAFTGGAAVTFENNAVLGSTLGGLKFLVSSSLVSHSGFWANAANTEGAVLGDGLVVVDPLLDDDYRPLPGSPYIDAGTPGCTAANGSRCDIGRFES